MASCTRWVRPACQLSARTALSLRSGALPRMAYLPLAPYDEGDALQALLCDASDGDDLALFAASWGDAAPLAGTPFAADFRCLEPEHGAACMRCAAGPVALCKNREPRMQPRMPPRHRPADAELPGAGAPRRRRPLTRRDTSWLATRARRVSGGGSRHRAALTRASPPSAEERREAAARHAHAHAGVGVAGQPRARGACAAAPRS